MGDGTHGEAGVLYFGTLGPWIYAVNASTGAEIWRSGGGVPAECVTYCVVCRCMGGGVRRRGRGVLVRVYDR